jgi:hypothetical protein
VFFCGPKILSKKLKDVATDYSKGFKTHGVRFVFNKENVGGRMSDVLLLTCFTCVSAEADLVLSLSYIVALSFYHYRRRLRLSSRVRVFVFSLFSS